MAARLRREMERKRTRNERGRTSNRLSFVLLLPVVLQLRETTADFDVTAAAVAEKNVVRALDIPKLITRINTESYRSQFLFNGTVDMMNSQRVMFSQIISNQAFGSYYHHWAGFNDGGFIGYYNKKVNPEAGEDLYSISFMLNGNHSCESHSKAAPCREYFEADPQTGVMRRSFKGVTYDCRKRAWYFDAAKSRASRWSDLYIDATANAAAFAYCAPLTNLTARSVVVSEKMTFDPTAPMTSNKASNFPEANPLIGVACSGMFTTDLSEEIRQSELHTGADLIYVRERKSNGLIAASVADRSAYYNENASSPGAALVKTNESKDALISRTAAYFESIGLEGDWPTEPMEIILPGNDTDDAGRDAYFLSLTNFVEKGIDWQIVVAQKVDCAPGTAVDEDKSSSSFMRCTACEAPKTSAGGAGGCTVCVKDHYYNKAKDKCLSCPEGAECAGNGTQPVNIDGWWGDRGGKSEGTYEFYPCETLAGAVCEANFECRKGYEDRHCARPEKGFMFAFGQSFKCDDNPGSKWTITLTLYVALVSFVLLVIYFTTQFDSFDLYLNSLQNLALVFSSQLTYPKMTYRASQVIFPIVLFDISESIYPTCVHPSWTWAHGYLLQMSTLPAAYLMFLVADATIAYSGRKSADDNAVVEDLTVGPQARMRRNSERRSKAFGFFLSYIDIAYCAVVLMSFQALTCRLESDDKTYLIVAPDIRCYHGIHNVIRPLAYIGIYGIGLCYPIYMGCFMILYRCETDSRHVTKVPHIDMILSTGYFFDSFHGRANWFSCAQLARNFLFCAVFTMDHTSVKESFTILPVHWRTPVMKGLLGIVVSLVYLSAVLILRPFVVIAMNDAEVLFVNAEIAVILLGVLFTSDDEEMFADSRFLESLQLLMLLTVYLLAASYINIQFLSNLIEKYVKADSAEHRINALWGKDAKLVKRVLLHRMVPGIWGARLRELQKMADDPNESVQKQVKEQLKTTVGMCQKLEEMMEHTHAMSYTAHDTFYHDLLRSFPRILGWILFTLSSASTTEFERDKGIIFDVFSKMHLYYLSERDFKPLSAGLDETCWAQVMYYALMKDTRQEDIDELFKALSHDDHAREDADAINVAFNIRKAEMQPMTRAAAPRAQMTITQRPKYVPRSNSTGFDIDPRAEMEASRLDPTASSLSGDDEVADGELSIVQKLQASWFFRQKIHSSKFYYMEREHDEDAYRAKGHLTEKMPGDVIKEEGKDLKRIMTRSGDEPPRVGKWWRGVLSRASFPGSDF